MAITGIRGFEKEKILNAYGTRHSIDNLMDIEYKAVGLDITQLLFSFHIELRNGKCPSIDKLQVIETFNGRIFKITKGNISKVTRKVNNIKYTMSNVSYDSNYSTLRVINLTDIARGHLISSMSGLSFININGLKDVEIDNGGDILKLEYLCSLNRKRNNVV